MSNKTPIKVIKRDQQKTLTIIKKNDKKIVTAKSAARDAVATVTGWVNEFQQKRREETKEAFKILFADISQQTADAGCTNC